MDRPTVKEQTAWLSVQNALLKDKYMLEVWQAVTQFRGQYGSMTNPHSRRVFCMENNVQSSRKAVFPLVAFVLAFVHVRETVQSSGCVSATCILLPSCNSSCVGQVSRPHFRFRWPSIMD